MAKGFNLTAEINLRGPSNIRTVVADIRRQLGTVNADVNVRINPSVTRNITALTAAINRLNSSLSDTNRIASQASTSLNALAGAGRQASTSLSNLPRNIQTAANATGALQNNVRQTARNMQVARTEFEEFGRQAALATRRAIAFSVAAGSLYKIASAINGATSEFIAFNKELVRVAQVTDTSVQNLGGLVREITALSTTFGVASKDLIQVSSTLAQAGLNARDTEKALKALALSAMAPSFDSLNDTVEGSIALMRQFGISAGDLEKALGSINAVAAKFAVESSDIITAIQRTGGVFAAASRGVSQGTDALNEFIAVFTSIRATTRESAETIATGLRTIFARIQRGSTIDALKEFGVTLTDLQGKFVGPYEAVRRLAESLNQLDPRDLRFARIVEELGGFRQIGKVIPLIQQFATAQQALAVAQKGQGSLANDAATAQQALAVKISKVREEFIALIRSVGQSDSFQSFVKLSLDLASALIRVAESAKSVLPALTAIAAIRGASFLTQFATGFAGGIRRAPPTGRGMATGGMVPGYGNTDTVPAMLTPGEFVIRKKAVEKIGVGNLARLNRNGGGPVQYLNGGGIVQKFAYGGQPTKKRIVFDDKSGGSIQRSHIGADVTLSKQEMQRYVSRYNNKQFQRAIKTRTGYSIEDISSGKFNYETLKSGLGLKVKERVQLNFPSVFNQALREGDPNLVSKRGLINYIRSSSNLMSGRMNTQGLKQRLISQILGLPARAYSDSNRPNDPSFDTDYELNALKSIIDPTGSQKNKLDMMFRPALQDAIYRKTDPDTKENIGSLRIRRQHRTTALRSRINKYAGGYIQKFMAGEMVKAAKKPTILSPQNLIGGPGYLKKGEWQEQLNSIITKNGFVRIPGSNDIMVEDQKVSLSDALSARTLGAAKFRERVGARNIVKLEKLRADLGSAYAGKRAGVVEEQRPRTAQEVSDSQARGLLFGAAGMYGTRFPAQKIAFSQADGLNSQVNATVFGALLDRDEAERQARLKKRNLMLQAAGVQENRDAETQAIKSAPTSKGLSKFFGYRASVRGVSKANKQLAIDTVNNIAQSLSPSTQGSQIFLDFDKTLAFGADKIGPKINKKKPNYAAFGDTSQVAAGLNTAKLSSLGSRLKKLVSDLDLKSPGLGNELLRRMFVVSARPQQTMPLIARWLRNQGLRIPPGNVTGVGGAGISASGIGIAKAEQILKMAGAGSVFIDDDVTNIEAARSKGINSIQYGSRITKKAKKQAAQQEGLQFEQFISEQLPAKLKTGIFGTSGEGIDFPSGLGADIAQNWFKDARLANIPVDTKRTLTGPRGKIKDNILSYLKAKGYNSGGKIRRFAEAGPVQPYYGQEEVEAARAAWSKFKSTVKKAWTSQSVYFEASAPKSVAPGVDPEVYGTGIGKLAKGEPGIVGSKRIRLAREKSVVSTDPREAARRKAVRKQDELALAALKGIIGGLPEDKQREVAQMFGLSPGIGPSLMPNLGRGGAGSAEELAIAKQGVSAFKKTGRLNFSKRFLDFFRSSLASYYLELKQASMMDPSDADLKKQLKKTRRAGVDIRRSLRTDSPIEVQGRRTAAGETLNLMLKERFQGFAGGGKVSRKVDFEEGVGGSPFNSPKPKLDYYSLQRTSIGLSPGEFDELVRFAKTNNLSLPQFKTYIDKRLAEKRSRQGIRTDTSALASSLMPERRFAIGGSVEDTVPALLTPGEFVINKKAAQRIGASRLHQLNRADRIQGFNKGGMVGGIHKFAKGGSAPGNYTANLEGAVQKAFQDFDGFMTTFGDMVSSRRDALYKLNRKGGMSAADAKQQADVQARGEGAQYLADRGIVRQDVATGLSKTLNPSGPEAQAAARFITQSMQKSAQSAQQAAQASKQSAGFFDKIKGAASSTATSVGGFLKRMKGPALSDEARQERASNRQAAASRGMAIAFAAPMIADQIGSAIGGKTGAGISGATSAFSTAFAVGSQFTMLGPAGPLAGAIAGTVMAIDGYNNAVREKEKELNTNNIEQESKNASKNLDILARDPNNKAASQAVMASITSMAAAEESNMKLTAEQRKPTMLQRAGSFLSFGMYDPTRRSEEDIARIGQENVTMNRAAADTAMSLLTSKVNTGIGFEEALKATGNAELIKKQIAQGAGGQFATREADLMLQREKYEGKTDANSQKALAVLDKQIEANREAAFKSETAALKAADADMQRAKAAEKLAQAINLASVSVDRTFKNMDSALSAAGAMLASGADRLDAMSSNKMAKASFAQQNVLENPSAYSARERTAAVQKASGFFGQDAGFIVKLTEVSSNIKDTMARMTAESPGKSKEATAENIQRNIDKQLRDSFGDNNLSRQISEQLRGALDKQIRNNETKEIDFDKLMSETTGLTSLIEAEQKAFKALADATKFASDSLNLYRDQLEKAAAMLDEANNIITESIATNAANSFRLTELLGGKVSLGDRFAARRAEGASRAGVSVADYSTKGLANRLNQLTATRNRTQANMDSYQAANSYTDPKSLEAARKFTASITNLDREINKTRDAIKNLPKDLQGFIDDTLNQMQQKIEKLDTRQQASASFAEKMVTSTPTELMGLNSTYELVSNTLNGQVRTIQQSMAAQQAYAKVLQDGGNHIDAMTAAQEAFANENRNAFGMFSELLTMSDMDKQQANNMRADFLTTMAQSQGLNVQNSPFFNQLIASLRRTPEEDPEIKALKDTITSLRQAQREAAETAAAIARDDATRLVKEAGSVVAKAIENVRIKFDEQQLQSIGLGISRPSQVMGRSQGGIVYASKGKFIPKGTDTVPAMLSPGEFVVNAKSTKENLPLLQTINKSQGGIVQYLSAGTARPVRASTKPADILMRNSIPVNTSTSAELEEARRSYVSLRNYIKTQQEIYRRQADFEKLNKFNEWASRKLAAARTNITTLRGMTPNALGYPISPRAVSLASTPRIAPTDIDAYLKYVDEGRTNFERQTRATTPTPQPKPTAQPKPPSAVSKAVKSSWNSIKDWVAEASEYVNKPVAAGAVDESLGFWRKLGRGLLFTGGSAARGIFRGISSNSASGALTSAGLSIGADAALGAAGFEADGAVRVGTRGSIDAATTGLQMSRFGNVALMGRIYAELGIQSAGEIYSAVSDTQAYIDNKEKEIQAQMSAGVEGDVTGITRFGSNVVGNIFGNSIVPGGGIPSAVGRLSVATGESMVAAEGAASSQSQLERSLAAQQADNQAKQDRLSAFNLTAEERTWVQRRARIEEAARRGVVVVQQNGTNVEMPLNKEGQKILQQQREDSDRTRSAKTPVYNKDSGRGFIPPSMPGDVGGWDMSQMTEGSALPTVYERRNFRANNATLDAAWMAEREGIVADRRIAEEKRRIEQEKQAAAKAAAEERKKAEDARLANRARGQQWMTMASESIFGSSEFGSTINRWKKQSQEKKDRDEAIAQAEVARLRSNEIQADRFLERPAIPDSKLMYQMQEFSSERDTKTASLRELRARIAEAEVLKLERWDEKQNKFVVISPEEKKAYLEQKRKEENALLAEIDRINQYIINSNEKLEASIPANERNKQWERYEKSVALAERREVIMERNKAREDEIKRVMSARNTIAKATGIPIPMDQNGEQNKMALPQWRARVLKTLEKRFYLSGDEDRDRQMLSSYGLSGDVLNTLYGGGDVGALNDEQKKATYAIMAEQTSGGYRKYNDNDLNLLKATKQQVIRLTERYNRGGYYDKLPEERRRELEREREKVYAKAEYSMKSINQLVQIANNAPAGRRAVIGNNIYKRLVRQGYIQPGTNDAIAARRLSALGLSSQAVQLVYPGQVGGAAAAMMPQNNAKGGVVYASKGKYVNFQPKGTDTVPAMLTPGEFVVNAKATSQHLPLLHAINDGKTQGYNTGGLVNYLQQGGPTIQGAMQDYYPKFPRGLDGVLNDAKNPAPLARKLLKELLQKELLAGGVPRFDIFDDSLIREDLTSEDIIDSIRNAATNRLTGTIDQIEMNRLINENQSRIAYLANRLRVMLTISQTGGIGVFSQMNNMDAMNYATNDKFLDQNGNEIEMPFLNVGGQRTNIHGQNLFDIIDTEREHLKEELATRTKAQMEIQGLIQSALYSSAQSGQSNQNQQNKNRPTNTSSSSITDSLFGLGYQKGGVVYAQKGTERPIGTTMSAPVLDLSTYPLSLNDTMDKSRGPNEHMKARLQTKELQKALKHISISPFGRANNVSPTVESVVDALSGGNPRRLAQLAQKHPEIKAEIERRRKQKERSGDPLDPVSKQLGGLIYAQKGGYLDTILGYAQEAALQAESFAYGVAKSVIPTAVGVGAGALTGWSGPGAAAVGVGAGVLTAKSQENILDYLMPEVNKHMNETMDARPWASLGGSAIGGGVTRAGGNVRKIPQLLKGTLGERAASGALGGGLSVGINAMDGELSQHDALGAAREAVVSFAIPGNTGNTKKSQTTNRKSLSPKEEWIEQNIGNRFSPAGEPLYQLGYGMQDDKQQLLEVIKAAREGFKSGKPATLVDISTLKSIMEESPEIRKELVGLQKSGVIATKKHTDSSAIDTSAILGRPENVTSIRNIFRNRDRMPEDQKTFTGLTDHKELGRLLGYSDDATSVFDIMTTSGKEFDRFGGPAQWVQEQIGSGKTMGEVRKMLEQRRSSGMGFVPVSEMTIPLFRGEGLPDPNAKPMPEWLTSGATYKKQAAAFGRWFTTSADSAEKYGQMNDAGFGYIIKQIRTTIGEADQHRVSNLALKPGGKDTAENPVAFSLDPTREWYLPKELSRKAQIIKTTGKQLGGLIYAQRGRQISTGATMAAPQLDLSTYPLSLNDPNDPIVADRNSKNERMKKSRRSQLESVLRKIAISPFGDQHRVTPNIESVVAALAANNPTQLDILAKQYPEIQREIEKRQKRKQQTHDPLLRSLGGIIYANKGTVVPYQPKGTDTVPAMLTPGEFVINRQATQKHLPLLKSINSGNYSRGGKISYLSQGGQAGDQGYSGQSMITTFSNNLQQVNEILKAFGGSIEKSVSTLNNMVQNLNEQLSGGSPTGVSNNRQREMPSLDGLDRFVSKFDQFITAVGKINLPPIINLQVAPIQVNITGAEALKSALEGPLGEMLQKQIRASLASLSASTEGAIRV